MRDSKRTNSTNGNGPVRREIVDLPLEMISEILSKLPTESILICRAVCKTWYDVSKDRCFINKLDNSQYQPTRLLLKPQVGRDINAPSYLVLVDIEKGKARQIPLDKMILDLQIMCSCNGFLCMASRKKLNPVVIYNPITMKRVILPPSNMKSTVLRHEVGFGFDPSTGKYKVVRAYTGFSSRRKVRRFEIISLGESSWRELTVPQSIANRDGWAVMFWNGALYWTMSKGISTIIVQFDLTDEEFNVISFPRHFYSRHASLGLIDVGGHLTLVQCAANVVKFWRIMENEVGGDLSLSLQVTYDTHVNWGYALGCSYVCQMNQESYLLQVGYWNHAHQRCENLSQYFPKKVQYSEFQIPGLPESFKTLCFKPSLAPLPATYVPSDW
ncbi:hypothetical protein Acr_23g0005580 [Actinidia rufa]|uniref:F-box domain-containing protein n=1 Tax=Actinidia rufa TaxID=165716 RepID=A0A7J0GMZ5_9ERIC|nr:hypothetical protein Acr_23g0005580 [Actinidia rufa]